jgi:hypothetical protein
VTEIDFSGIYATVFSSTVALVSSVYIDRNRSVLGFAFV